MAIALWFCPVINSPTYEILKSLISSLQTLFPDGILFEPHLTITSNLKCNTKHDIEQIMNTLMAAIYAVKPKIIDTNCSSLVTFDGISVGKGYFDKVRLTCCENKFLYSIAQIIREMFVSESIEDASNWLLQDFKPHVSLVYSDIYQIDQAMLRILSQRIEDSFDLTLMEVEKHTESDQCHWTFNRHINGWNIPGSFKIVECEGHPNQWKILASIDV